MFYILQEGVSLMTDDIELILQEGEGYKAEFKESVSRLDKEMCAFSNSSGGTIYVGITDKGEIKPHKLTNKLKSEIMDIARNCDPSITIRVQQTGPITRIDIPEGDNKPYGCASGFYLRIGPNSQKMRTREIISMITSETQVLFDSLVNKKFDYENLDTPLLNQHFRKTGIDISGRLDDIMCTLSLAKREDGKIHLTNAGVLLFSNEPPLYIMSSLVTCVRYKGNTKYKIIDRKDFRGNLMEQVEEALKFISRNTRVEYVITGKPAREEILEYPEEVIREAVINAVLHRDYFDQKMVTQVDIYDDRIEITNPGGLVKGLTVEDLGKTAVHRNPVLVDFFHRIGQIEKIGSGIGRMRRGMKEAGHPGPMFDISGVYFRVVLPSRKAIEPVEAVDDRVRDVVNDVVGDVVNDVVKQRLAEELILLVQKGFARRQEIETMFKISYATAQRDIALLKQHDLILFEGPPKTGRYVLTGKGKRLLGA